MKIKRLIILLIILLIPTFVNAHTLNTDVISTETTISKISDYVDLENVLYKKDDKGNFTLTGTIKNKLAIKTKFEIKINYYDVNGKKIYTQVLNEELDASKAKKFKATKNIKDVAEINDINTISKYSVEINSTSEVLENMAYTIDKYDISIKVQDDNTYFVTELITVNYISNNKPFKKIIPIKEKDDYKNISISNLEVDADYSFRKTKENYIVEIDGLAKKDTTKTYKITYEYNYGKDTTTEYDKLYYVLNGINQDTIISNITYSVEMPYEFDTELLETAKMNTDVSTSRGITSNVNNRIITGKYNKELYPGEQLVINCLLEDNYFKNAKENNSISIIIMVIIPTISVIIAFIMWLIFGKDNKNTSRRVSTVPDKLNSMEIGYLYKGKATSLDIASMILEFANKGYIKIEEDESDFALIKSFELHKVKEYKGKNNKERLIFENLFKNKDIVTPEDLDNNFYSAVTSVLEDLNDQENQGRIFENTTNQTFALIIFTVISIFAVIFIPSIEYGSVQDSVVSIFMLSLFALIYAGIYSIAKNKLIKTLIIIVVGLHMLSYIPTLPISYALFNDLGYLLAFLFGVLCIILLIIFIRIMPKRTAYGNKMLAKINGLKKYLETIKKEEITSKLKDNPDYFYDMLPYAFALGISNVWIKKFERTKLDKPKWTSIKPFHYTGFTTFITHSVHTMDKNIKNNYR